MTEQQHPITPPPELVQQWAQNRGYSCANELWEYLATHAARWGADQELEACCELIGSAYVRDKVRSARRPKPPSLKEQALALLDKAEDPRWDINDFSIVRKALEQLDD